MICAKERGRGYLEEQAHGGAADGGAEAVGGGTQGGGHGAGRQTEWVYFASLSHL
jgi:hypothetical protein